MKISEADILIAPGLGNSGPGHWQRRWGGRMRTARFIEQDNWDLPVLADWIVPVTIVARDGSAAVPTPVAVPPWPEALGSAGLAVLCVLAAACWVGLVAGRLSISTLLRSESAASR